MDILDLRQPRLHIEIDLIVRDVELRQRFRELRKRYGKLSMPMSHELADIIRYLDKTPYEKRLRG